MEFFLFLPDEEKISAGVIVLPDNGGVIKQKKSLKERVHLSMLLMLALPSAMAWYYYGKNALILIFSAVVTALICEKIVGFILRLNTDLLDCNAAFIGAAVALMLPATAPVWYAVLGASFAIVVAKLPFGVKSDRLPFVPAAAGFAFLCLCFPQGVFDYPAADFGSAFTAVDGVSGISIAHLLTQKTAVSLNAVSFIDIAVGHMPGPMGATSVLVLLTSAVFFVFRHPRSALNSLGFLASCALMSVLFPRVLTGALASLTLELCSGMLVFTALFLISDPAGSPKGGFSRFLYGGYAGILCMLLRYFGAFEEGACFAVLLANASWPLIENNLNRNLIRLGSLLKKKRTDSESGKEGASA